MKLLSHDSIRSIVQETINKTPIIDIHTHIFPPSFTKLLACGIDEILTYHYLVAELFRFHRIEPQEFWKLSQAKQADLVWRYLFIENSPISEATIGVLTILKNLGIDCNQTLNAIRAEFKQLQSGGWENYLASILAHANVKQIVMTNDPVDPLETAYWRKGSFTGEVFQAAVRLDSLLQMTPRTAQFNGKEYYLPDDSVSLLQDSIELIHPVYLAVSLPDTFSQDSLPMKFLATDVFPVAQEYNLPVAMMIGVRRGVNQDYRLAGDGVGKFDIRQLERICQDYPSNKFLITLLSRENQYELTVLARKFANLMPFGAWWFLNNPFNFREITEMRVRLLGFSFIPQHSDARVWEHLIYKWEHCKQVLTDVMSSHYEQLLSLGKSLSQEHVAKDVSCLLSDNFKNFCR